MSRPTKPWFRKSNKRWYVWHNGKQVNLSADRTAAHKKFHELMAQPEKQEAITCSGTLVELVDAYLEWVQRNRSAETYEWYRYRLERLCREYPQMQAASIRPYHIENWVNRYDLAVTSRRNYFRSAKRCFKWGRQQGYLTVDPLMDMEVPGAEEKEVFLTASEYEQLLTYVRNQCLRDLITVTWETGCRPQESLKVEARHVDVENQRWVFYKSESKGKRISRVVYLTDTAMSIVQRLMLAHPDGPLFRNNNGKLWKTEAVNCAFTAIQMRMGRDQLGAVTFTDQETTAFVKTLKQTRVQGGVERKKTPGELRSEAVRKLTFKRAAKVAPRYSLYALRHSFATNALQKGIDSMTVAVLLGHADPSTLARVYQHLNQNPKHLLDQAKRAAG